jgi:hypothetical protein
MVEGFQGHRIGFSKIWSWQLVNRKVTWNSPRQLAISSLKLWKIGCISMDRFKEKVALETMIVAYRCPTFLGSCRCAFQPILEVSFSCWSATLRVTGDQKLHSHIGERWIGWFRVAWQKL